MIYTPILKCRQAEKRVIASMVDCFSEGIIPLLEVIQDEYSTKYRKDPITGQYVTEMKGTRNYRLKETPTDNDIITLEHLNGLLNGKKAFIDFFRFSVSQYSKDTDLSKIALSWTLSNNNDEYIRRLLGVGEHTNLIPVLSIKGEFGVTKHDLELYLRDLREKNSTIALRITEDWFKDLQDIIRDSLRDNDYLLFDINEQIPESKFMEYEEIKESGITARVVILNSPRKASTQNKEFEVSGITELVNNSIIVEAEKNNFAGFGDYCGFRDDLPKSGGSKGLGRAHALIYDYNENGFYTFLNPNVKLGLKGYESIRKNIISNSASLNPDDDCPAFKKIKGLAGTGNWSTWHEITMLRYIHQIYKNI